MQLILADRNLARHDLALLTDLKDQLAGNPAQNMTPLWRGSNDIILHDKQVAGRALGRLAIPDQNRFDRLVIHRVLLMQYVRQQVERLDIAITPTVILTRNGLYPLGVHLLRRVFNQLAHDQHRRPHIPGEHMIPPLHNTAGNLQIDHRVLSSRIIQDQLVENLLPVAQRQRVGNLQRIQATLQALHMLLHREGITGVNRKHLVHPITKHKASVQYRDTSLCCRQILTIQID